MKNRPPLCKKIFWTIFALLWPPAIVFGQPQRDTSQQSPAQTKSPEQAQPEQKKPESAEEVVKKSEKEKGQTEKGVYRRRFVRNARQWRVRCGR